MMQPGVSRLLAAAMLERVAAMDNIRALLGAESDRESELRAEFTKRVHALEVDAAAGEDVAIGLRPKNGDYARQLGRLSSTVHELVDSNHANIERMSELERDVAGKAGTIEGLEGEVQRGAEALEGAANENAELERQLIAYERENANLEAVVEDFHAKL